IWFVDQHATIYRPEELAAVVEWLRNHKLLQGVYHGEQLDPAKSSTMSLRFSGVSGGALKVSVSADAFPIPSGLIQREPEIPFIRHEYVWSWEAIAEQLSTGDDQLGVAASIDVKNVYAKDDVLNNVGEKKLRMGSAETRLPRDMMAAISWHF